MPDSDKSEIDVSELATSDPQDKDQQVPDAPHYSEQESVLVRWQENLLPFMQLMIVALTALFFVITVIHYGSLQQYIRDAPRLDWRPEVSATPSVSGEEVAVVDNSQSDSESYRREQEFWANRLRVLASLEGHLIDRKFYQANISMMSRVWIRYVGFITGVTLAMVGATFILGKLREENTQIEGEYSDAKAKIASSSPGLILAVLGVVLMMMALVIRHDVDVGDTPRYLSGIYEDGNFETTDAPTTDARSPNSLSIELEPLPTLPPGGEAPASEEEVEQR